MQGKVRAATHQFGEALQTGHTMLGIFAAGGGGIQLAVDLNEGAEVSQDVLHCSAAAHGILDERVVGDLVPGPPVLEHHHFDLQFLQDTSNCATTAIGFLRISKQNDQFYIVLHSHS